MTEQGNERRFRAVPRTPVSANPDRNDYELFRAELDKVWIRLDRVATSNREEFHDGSPSYDQAGLAIIRVAAMLEEASPFNTRFSAMSERARRAIITTRNILSHSGYASMNVDLLWVTVTVDLPAELDRLGMR